MTSFKAHKSLNTDLFSCILTPYYRLEQGNFALAVQTLELEQSCRDILRGLSNGETQIYGIFIDEWYIYKEKRDIRLKDSGITIKREARADDQE